MNICRLAFAGRYFPQTVAVLLLWCVVGAPSAQARNPDSGNEQIIRDFIGAWSRLDADELVGYFAEDGTYFNMPITPVTGHEDLRTFISGFLASWDETDWQILNLVAEGDLVIVERVDTTVVAGRKVALPCVGVFEMAGGKIKVWRDYFDMATFTNAVAPPNT